MAVGEKPMIKRSVEHMICGVCSTGTAMLALVCVSCAALSTPAFANTAPPGSTLSQQQIAAIDAAATDALARTGVPAASIAIVQDGRIVYTRAYGLQRPGQAARTDAPYAIASVSKQFTAAAILILAEEGRLSLDDKVAKYLPELTRAREVTIRQLLTHMSGYRDYWPQDYLFAAMTQPATPSDILRRWAQAPLDFEPGTRFQYSNTGYVAAGLIVERVSSQSLFAFLRAHVFARLGMAPTDIDAGLPGSAPLGHSRFGLGPVRLATPMGSGWSFAAGELVMTATDLARWDISMIDRSVMSPASYAAQQTEAVLKSGLGTGYGLGVYVDSVAGHRRVRHRGGQSGFLSENRVYPDDAAAIVVLDNADFGDAEVGIADAIEQQLFAVGSGVARARALYDMMRSGHFDHSAFTADGNAYFTPAAIADYRSSLAPLGEPRSFVETGTGRRGGFTVERFLLTFNHQKLELTLRTEPDAMGRVEEFMLSPDS